ncbi:MAG: hypothetical protein JNL70_06150 [Saprospiraceae bacterium]|nr:hypothetical protein [Saprospiraceae bacterium]
MFFSTGLAYKSRLDAIEKEKLKQDNVQLALEKELDLARIRNEVSQDIHDEIGAGLTKISLTAAYMERLPELNLIDIREKANRLMQEAQQLRYKLKEIVFAINPEYDGFDEMQAYFRDYASDFWTDTHVSLQFNFPKSSLDTPSVSPKVKRNLLHIFVEAQNNAAKYSQATQIDLTLTQLDKYQYLLEIKDNGIGFVPYSHNIHSKGLSGIKQRAKSIQAQLTIDSEHQHGTTIRVQGFL